jgi:hypothetical protein
VTTFWLWVSAGCACSALIGFSAVRLAPRLLNFREIDPASTPIWGELPPTTAHERPAATATADREPTAAATPHTAQPRSGARAGARGSVPSRLAPKQPPSAATGRPLAPTAAEPDAEKLALWARQVKAGERKMSVATDGCRVTWNRTCKHGHPTWLVQLGYLEPGPPPPRRHTPR